MNALIHIIADSRYFETRAEMLRRKWREEQIAAARNPKAPITNGRFD